MNLRKLTLRYMGWCPGVKSAARFIPDKEMSTRSVVLSAVVFTTILLSSGFALTQYYMKTPETGPLMVTIYDPHDSSIERITYPDDVFDEHFNYSELRDMYIDFILPPASGFSTSGKTETQIHEFEKLEDVWLLLEELDTPRVVTGFAKWLANGTFEDVHRRFYGYCPSELKDLSSTPEIRLSLGRRDTNRCYFTVHREPSPLGDIPTYVDGFDGIFVTKMKMEIGRGLSIWTLYIRLNDAPPFSTVFRRNPYPSR